MEKERKRSKRRRRKKRKRKKRRKWSKKVRRTKKCRRKRGTGRRGGELRPGAQRAELVGSAGWSPPGSSVMELGTLNVWSRQAGPSCRAPL